MSRITEVWRYRVGLMFALALFGASTVEAQNGTIMGRVTDGRLQPVGSAQVFISELSAGTLTRTDGSFILLNVPPGTHTLSVRRIGFREATRQLSVAAGETLTANFQLTEDALALDAIVVTGTPGATQRRAIGNVVGRVEAAEITQLVPVASMQQLLTARTPGLTFHGSDGNIGSGRTIRIRGVSSLALSQQPLVYIDGVRIDNDSQVGPTAVRASRASRFNDINPNDIESIEVIKGPAAATLYGTEASAGVIQIITKKGASGAAQWDFTVRQGANWLQGADWKVGDAYALDDNGELISFNIIRLNEELGTPILQTGHLQSYNLGVRGGTDAARYYLSADWEDNEGMVDYNWNQRLGLRANLSLVPRENLTIDTSFGYLDGTTSFMQASRFDLWYSLRMSSPSTLDTKYRGFFRSPPEESRKHQAYRDYQRFTGSSTITFTPFEWMRSRLIFGTDQTNDKNTYLLERQLEGLSHFFGGDALGIKDVSIPKTVTNTVDFATSLMYRLNDDFGFTTSVGMQYYDFTSEQVNSEGRVFPSPVITSISGAAEVFTSESYLENATVGVYLQQEFNWRDRLYLTAAIRGDDNSAFGADYNAAIYPKLSGTWVVSDEPFWRWSHIVNSLRLRSAWGKAGRQPPTFAATTLYGPGVGPDGEPVIEPDVLGNPDLGPEVSSEIEVGFDVAMFDDRLTGEFTHYRQKVNDALASMPISSSVGFAGSQSVNLGQLSNWGYEVRVDARVLERPRYSLSLGGSYSHTMNRVDDLGGRPPTETIREGFRFPSVWYITPIRDSGRFNENGQAVDIMCDGGVNVVDGFGFKGGEPVLCSQAPRLYWGPLGNSPNEASMDATITIGQSLTLYAMGEYRGFHRIEGNDPPARITSYQNDRFSMERSVPWIVACAVDGASGTPACPNGRRTVAGANAEFAKLREVSATYAVPTSLTDRLGVSRASISVAGRDLLTWQAQRCVPDWTPGYPHCYGGTSIADPETRDPSQSLGGGNANSGGVVALPGLSSVVLTARFSF